MTHKAGATPVKNKSEAVRVSHSWVSLVKIVGLFDRIFFDNSTMPRFYLVSPMFKKFILASLGRAFFL